MRLRSFIERCLLACVLLRTALSGSIAYAAGVYAQLVVPFPSDRVYSYSYVKAENALVIEFQKTSPSELAAFDHYDERLIKRVVMKDLGPSGTEVKVILRDRKVRALVTKFSEPFRVTIDLFDAGYEEERDPTTGLPLVTPPGAGNGASAAVGGQDDWDMQEKPSSASQETPSHASTPAKKLKLLQPVPQAIEGEAELSQILRDAPEGGGKAWAGYPPYLYRIQTAAFEAGLASERAVAADAMVSSKAMADYAGKLYNLGNETRALIVYQQVLHKDPSLFDKDALHLWKLSEIHLGQGNLTLARGYYQSLIEKHPESPLAAFARLRILDITALRLASQDRDADLPTLLPNLETIRARHVGELQAQVAIRKAYWGKDSGAAKGVLPKIDGGVRNELGAAYPNAESSKTAFLAASLVLNDMVRSDTPWQRSTGPFAQAYFKRFSGEPTEAYRVALRDRLYDKLNGSMQSKVTEGKLVEAIDDYEALPESLRGIKKSPATAWALAEAYRKLGQGEKAIDLYATAAKSNQASPDKFKAQFWLAVTAGDVAEQSKDKNQAKTTRLRQMSRDADKGAEATWKALKKDERTQLQIAYKEPFEKTISNPTRLRTPAKIVLSSWTSALTTAAPATSGAEPTDWQRQFSPTGSAVILLTDLSKRFSELGMTNERRQAIGLLKGMKPAQFEDDKAAKEIWASELVKLAEDYRNASQYLDAGRIYSLVGGESENWEGRAEALYKGGLLLYRAGRREEALEAFKKAESDGNNLFYANLAKERLSQLEQ